MHGSWRDAVALPAEVQRGLPRGYDLVGHVAIVRLSEAARPHAREIGEALLAKVPSARTAAVDWGVEGEHRVRRMDVLAGEPVLTTEQRENGCRLIVDLATCYYSARLAGERRRVADLVVPGEDVLDMYCGVGPYSVLVAKRGARVTAAEINPAAARLCRENAQRNKVARGVDVVLADAPALAASLPPRFDRVIMNLPRTAAGHLSRALHAAARGATIHLAALLPRDSAGARAAALAQEHGLRLERLVHVRNYNPAIGHYTLDLRMAP